MEGKRMAAALLVPVLCLALLPAFALGSGAEAELALPEEATGYFTREPAADGAAYRAPAHEASYYDAEAVYARLIAMKDSYPEGMGWTNADSYDGTYEWHGGLYDGMWLTFTGRGCAGFALLLSDAAFPDEPIYETSDFAFEDVRVGDILRINYDTHSVIVLEVHEDYVVIAEGNYNNSIHWGRTLSRAEVEAADYMYSRYPALPAAEENKCGENVTWTLEDGVLTISGTGPMANYDYETAPWYDQRESITRLVVEDGVTRIGELCFWNLEWVTSVELADSITYIGRDGLSYLTSLEELPLPAGLTGFDTHALGGCEALKTLVLPEGLGAISDGAFVWNRALSRVYIPAGVTSIGEYAFSNCLSLTQIYYGGTEDQWKAIEIAIQEDDDGTDAMSRVTIRYESTPEEMLAAPAVTPEPTPTPTPTPGPGPDLPGDIADAGVCGFSRSLTGPEDFEHYQDFWADNLTWTLDTNGTLTISGEGEMFRCTMLNFGTRYIVTSPWFGHRNDIKKVVVESGVTSIGHLAFQDCKNLTAIMLPDTIGVIYSDAFKNTALRDIWYEGTSGQWSGIGDYSGYRGATVHYGYRPETAATPVPVPTPEPLTAYDAARLLQDIVSGKTEALPPEAAAILRQR